MKARDPLSRQAPWFDPCFEPLVAVVRGAGLESLHRGAVAVVDSGGDLLGGVGDPATAVYLRSAAKPFQALAVVDSGAADAVAMSQEELAVLCGSHSGQPEHVRVVEGLLARLGVDPGALVCCPASTASEAGAAEGPGGAAARPGGALERPGAPESGGAVGSPLRHNCSGKHAGMVALALHLGAPVKGYEQLQHPVQQEVARVVKSLLARRPGQPARRPGGNGAAAGGLVFAGLDGCGVPVMRLSLRDAAWLYALLAAGATPGLARVRDAMLAYPLMVGGDAALDTRVMRATGGRIVAKSGAEGVQALALPRTFRLDPGEQAALGCVFKVEDGSKRPLPALVGAFLRAQGMLEASERLEIDYPLTIEDSLGREAGRLLPLLGDADLRRREPTPGDFESGDPDEGERPEKDHERDVKLVVGRGDEKEIHRFLRTEWPPADEETFGKPVEWNAEPIALILRRRRQIVAVLKGHFLGGVGAVDELLVGRGQRGMGAGSALLRRFEEEAAKRDCSRLVLRAVKGGKAEAFYRDRGYSREALQLSYEFGRDYVRLTRRLARGDEGA